MGKGFDPNQPRVPKGDPSGQGGHWTDRSIDTGPWTGAGRMARLAAGLFTLRRGGTFPWDCGGRDCGSKAVLINSEIVDTDEMDHLPIYIELVLENPDQFEDKWVQEAYRLNREGRVDDSRFETVVMNKIGAISLEIGFQNNLTITGSIDKRYPTSQDFTRFVKEVVKAFERGLIDYPKAKTIHFDFGGSSFFVPYDRILDVRNVTVDDFQKPLVHYK